MEERLKRRLVGATVLVSLIVIFVPMLLEDEPIVEVGIFKTNVPAQPESDFSSRILPLASTVVTSAPKTTKTAKTAEIGEISGKGNDKDEKSGKPRVGLSAWVIQVGSFSSRENAETLVEKLQKKKFPAFLEQTELKGKNLYRVRVGPEIDQKLAEKLLTKLNKTLKPMKLEGSLKRYR